MLVVHMKTLKVKVSMMEATYDNVFHQLLLQPSKPVTPSIVTETSVLKLDRSALTNTDKIKYVMKRRTKNSLIQPYVSGLVKK